MQLRSALVKEQGVLKAAQAQLEEEQVSSLLLPVPCASSSFFFFVMRVLFFPGPTTIFFSRCVVSPCDAPIPPSCCFAIVVCGPSPSSLVVLCATKLRPRRRVRRKSWQGTRRRGGSGTR
eukprot:304038-Rhodomonas_salina.2